MDMLKYSVELLQLKKRIEEIENEKYDLRKAIVKCFMNTWNTDTIYFDYVNQDCPNYQFCTFDKDDEETLVKSITFNEDGTIKRIVGYLYYLGDEVDGEETDFYNIDDFELAEFVNAQTSERYLPEEDE